MSRNDIYDYACPSGLYKCGGIAPVKATDDMTQAVGQRNGQLYTFPSGGTGIIPDPTHVPDGYVLSVQDGMCVWVPAPSGLPEVTAADNGKVMTVVGGTWTAADPVSGDVSVRGRRFRGIADIDLPDPSSIVTNGKLLTYIDGSEAAIYTLSSTSTQVLYTWQDSNDYAAAVLDSGLQWEDDNNGRTVWWADDAPDLTQEQYEWFISLYEEEGK